MGKKTNIVCFRIIILFIITVNSSFGQKISEKDVPAIIKHNLDSLYLGSKADKWEKHGTDYNAWLVYKEIKKEIIFLQDGSVWSTKTGIPINELPASIREDIKNNYPDKEIINPSVYIRKEGIHSYSVEINGEEIFFPW